MDSINVILELPTEVWQTDLYRRGVVYIRRHYCMGTLHPLATQGVSIFQGRNILLKRHVQFCKLLIFNMFEWSKIGIFKFYWILVHGETFCMCCQSIFKFYWILVHGETFCMCCQSIFKFYWILVHGETFSMCCQSTVYFLSFTVYWFTVKRSACVVKVFLSFTVYWFMVKRSACVAMLTRPIGPNFKYDQIIHVRWLR